MAYPTLPAGRKQAGRGSHGRGDRKRVELSGLRNFRESKRSLPRTDSGDERLLVRLAQLQPRNDCLREEAIATEGCRLFTRCSAPAYQGGSVSAAWPGESRLRARLPAPRAQTRAKAPFESDV